MTATGTMAPRWVVYMLRCRDGSLYTGATNDLPRRLQRHSAGRGAAYTRSRLPVALVYVEPAAGRSAALRREAALKRLKRPDKLGLAGPGSGPGAPIFGASHSLRNPRQGRRTRVRQRGAKR